jgi:hypothetical protein
MVHTTLPKVDTSSAEAPTVWALVTRPGSKAPDDNLADDDPDLLNHAMVESGIASWMSSLLQRYWPDSGKPEGPIFALGYEDVEGGLWVLLWLVPLIFLPLVILQTFWLDHPR